MDRSSTRIRVEHYHVHYIRTSVDRLWRAMTEPAETAQYYHGLEVQSRFEPGAPISYLRRSEDGTVAVVVSGTILECEPERRLVHTFRFADNPDPETRVTYELEALGEVVKLTVLHDEFTEETETYKVTREGWGPIFSGLKTLLETGEPLGVTLTRE